MPPILAPLSPDALKDAFVATGWKVIDEDEYNWLLARGDSDEPFVLPKKGARVSVPVMQAALAKGRGTPLTRALVERVAQQQKDAHVPDPGSSADSDKDE